MWRRKLQSRLKYLLLEIAVLYIFISIIMKTTSVHEKHNCPCSTTQHATDPSEDVNKVSIDTLTDTTSERDYGLLEVYDLTKESTDQPICVPLRILSNPKICVHNVSQDAFVSGQLYKEGVWEPDIMQLFQNILTSDKDLGVIDIGANLGLYSLIGASMGRKVLAVEPFDVNVRPFHKAIQLNGFQHNVRLVTNAIGNNRGKVFFKTYANNKGGTSMWEGRKACIKKKCPFAMSVYMDDLLPLIKEMKMMTAIMKIDIEGAEHLALAEASALFKHLNIRFVLMEIIIQTRFCSEKANDSEDKRLVMKMFEFLVSEGFTRVFPAGDNSLKGQNKVKAKQRLRQKGLQKIKVNMAKKRKGRSLYGMDGDGLIVLDPTHCSPEWPRDVLWVHESQKYPL